MLYANHTWMSTMWASKSIIDEYISKSTQFFSKFRNILLVNFYFDSFIILLISFLLRIEPDILTEEDFTVGVVDFINYVLSDAVIKESNRSPEHVLQWIQERFEGIFLVLAPVRASKVGEEDDRLWAMLD